MNIGLKDIKALSSVEERQNHYHQHKLLPYLDYTEKLIFKELETAKIIRPENGSTAFKVVLEEQDLYWKVANCLKHGTKHLCPTGHHVYKPEPCRHQNWCVSCGRLYTIRQGSRIMELLNAISEKVDGLRFCRLVFTVPKLLWDKIDYSNFDVFNHACYKTLEEYYHAKVGGVGRDHNWHSKYPLAGNFPHFHSSFVNLGFVNGRPIQLRYDIDLDKMRSIYRRNLERAFGVKIAKVNLHYEHIPVDDKPNRKHPEITNRNMIWHGLRYDFRLANLDITRFAKKQMIGEFEDEQKGEVTRLIMPPTNFRFTRFFGWWADGVRNKYLKLLDIEPILFSKKREPKDVICPVHNLPCELVDNWVAWDDIKNEENLVVNFLKPPDKIT